MINHYKINNIKSKGSILPFFYFNIFFDDVETQDLASLQIRSTHPNNKENHLASQYRYVYCEQRV